MKIINSLRTVHDPEEIDESAWSKFVLENEKGNIFQTPEMYRVFLNTERYEPVFTAIADDNGNIVATMLGALIQEPGYLVAKLSRRVVVYGGPIISSQVNMSTALQEILRAHNNEVQKKAIFTEIRNLAPTARLRSTFESMKYKYVDHLDIHVDLTIGIDNLWRSLHKSRRRGIRKAIKSGLTCVDLTSENLDDLYSIVKQMYTRIRIPMPPRSLFGAIMTILQKKGLARTIGVDLNGELVGIGVVLSYKDTIYAWYGSDDRRYSHLDINAYRVWSTMKWGVERGFKLFDFGGAGQRGRKYGVREFKRSMGGHEVELGRLVCTHKRMKSFATSAGFRVWRVIKRARLFIDTTK